MSEESKLIAVTKLSTRGTSIRMTLPKDIAVKLEISEGDHLGFYEMSGHIILRRIK